MIGKSILRYIIFDEENLEAEDRFFMLGVRVDTQYRQIDIARQKNKKSVA
jgi:hypothetical protein